MATYKVPQDVEAEDKLIGFLSFRQFIFVIVGLLMSTAAFFGFQVNLVIGLLFVLPAGLFFLLGLYQPKDQPVETKLVALVNFFLRPHKRVWNRDGISEHVIIKAPKLVEKHYSDNRSRSEVKSQLKMLAQIIDTRGWSTKRSELQLPGADGTITLMPGDDRLIDPSLLQSPIDALDIHPGDDVMDEIFNPVAQTFDAKAQQTTQQAREHALRTLRMAQAKQTPVQPMVSPAPKPALPAELSSANAQTASLPEQNPPVDVHFKPFPSIHQSVIEPLGSDEPTSQQPPAQSSPALPENQTSSEEASAKTDDTTMASQGREPSPQDALEEDEAVSLH